MPINNNQYDPESFEDSLNRFRANLKKDRDNDKKNHDRPDGHDEEESDLPYYEDLEETCKATGEAVKKAIL
jgi:hypothetical protein